MWAIYQATRIDNISEIDYLSRISCVQKAPSSGIVPTVITDVFKESMLRLKSQSPDKLYLVDFGFCTAEGCV